MAASPVVEPAVRQRSRLAPRWQVVLLDDDDHTYAYVIEMLQRLCGLSPERGWLLAREVDTRGRAVVWTGHREVAELKQEQIHAYGPDWRLPRCQGSMSAVLEPAGD